MNFPTIWRLAWNILAHSKLRSWLTIIGIVVGVAAVVLIVSIGVVISIIFSSFNIAFGPPGTAPLKAIVTPFLVIGMLVFSTLIGVASGVAPALRASRLQPAQALKYE